MKKTLVIYWSGTGNTEAMANAVVDGMKEAGADVTCWTVDDVKADAVAEFDAVAMGCPAMGAEVLEETEFDPMYQSIKASLSGKAVGLFVLAFIRRAACRAPCRLQSPRRRALRSR